MDSPQDHHDRTDDRNELLGVVVGVDGSRIGLDAVRWARREGVKITEGPVDWRRRTTCFIRDPDGNVLEFNELKPA